MPSFRSIATASLLLLSTASTHFVLINPTSLEGQNIDDDKLANGPCGAKTPDLANDEATDFHVDGDFINVRLTHPQATWLFRGTVEETSKNNWTALFPQVQQTGLGQFCEPAVTAPKEWVGKKGVIGVACKGEDGLLFQVCAPHDPRQNQLAKRRMSYSAPWSTSCPVPMRQEAIAPMLLLSPPPLTHCLSYRLLLAMVPIVPTLHQARRQHPRPLLLATLPLHLARPGFHWGVWSLLLPWFWPGRRCCEVV